MDRKKQTTLEKKLVVRASPGSTDCKDSSLTAVKLAVVHLSQAAWPFEANLAHDWADSPRRLLWRQ